MSEPPPILEPLWQTVPPEAQAALRARFESLEQRIAELDEQLGKNSTNSSRPSSSGPPSVKRRPPAPASGRKRGGEPGHRHHSPSLVPPERIWQALECRPSHCRCGSHELHGDDPEPRRHQVAEVPPIEPAVDEYRLHRLKCPRCGASTCDSPPPAAPAGAFGPRLRAILSILAGAYRPGKRPIHQLAHDLLGLLFALGLRATR